MKILSINDFTKHFSKRLSDHLKGTKKTGSKVIIRQLFHRKTVFHIKYCLLSTLLLNFLVSKILFNWTPIERSLRSLIVKLLIDNIFIERLGLSTKKNPKNKSACVQVKTCRVNNFFLLINLA